MEELLDDAQVRPGLLRGLFPVWRRSSSPCAAPSNAPTPATTVSGLLTDLKSKDAESIASLFDRERQGLRTLIGQASWAPRPLIRGLARQVARRFSEVEHPDRDRGHPGFAVEHRQLQDRSAFGFVPETGVMTGVMPVNHVRLTLGYSLPCWYAEVRPGDQIDPRLNRSAIPGGPTFGSAKDSGSGPNFSSHESSFRVQNLTAVERVCDFVK